MDALEQARAWCRSHQEEATQRGEVHLCTRACLLEAWMSGAAYASEESRVTVAAAIAGVASERRTRDRDIGESDAED